MFMSLNIDRGSASMGALKPVADVLKQSEDNCLFAMHPQLNNNLKKNHQNLPLTTSNLSLWTREAWPVPRLPLSDHNKCFIGTKL